jgi:hypothetical protein
MASKDLVIASKKDLAKVNKALAIAGKAVQEATSAIASLTGEETPAKKPRAKKEKTAEVAPQIAQPAVEQAPAPQKFTTKPTPVKAPAVKAKANGAFPKMPGAVAHA